MSEMNGLPIYWANENSKKGIENNIPTELVEKMSQHVDMYNNKGQIDHDLSWKRSEQCAQIAVDYADGCMQIMGRQIGNLLRDKSELRQQNDELLEALRGSTKTIEWYMENCTTRSDATSQIETFFNLGANRLEQNEQLINRIDGE